MLRQQVIGTLNIYSGSTDAFNDVEIQLLQELTEDLAFGIRHQRAHLEQMHNADRLHEALVGTIQAISLTLEKRDPYTAGHQRRVAQLAVAMSRVMGMDEDYVEGVRFGAMIHDFGKIYVPSEILNRPGTLSESEFAIIKTHPDVGYDIIKDIDFPWPVNLMIHQHHERLDGSGYPRGLKSDEISFEAKILMVADVVEAMSSHRPYRPGLGVDAALATSRIRGVSHLMQRLSMPASLCLKRVDFSLMRRRRVRIRCGLLRPNLPIQILICS